MADDPAESPDCGLFDCKGFGSDGRLGVCGDQIQKGPDRVVFGERLGQMKDREQTYRAVSVGRGADIHRPAVDDAVEATVLFEVRFRQPVQLFGLTRVERVPALDLRELRDALM